MVDLQDVLDEPLIGIHASSQEAITDGLRNSPRQEPRDQAEIVRQFTKADHRLEHTDNPGLIVSRLLQIAISEPKGPVYLTMPRETAMLPLPGTIRFPTVQQLGVARPVSPDLAFNTAVSFTTNTNWQSYAGESAMSQLSQMVALTFHNFASAAVGIGPAAAGLT